MATNRTPDQPALNGTVPAPFTPAGAGDAYSVPAGSKALVLRVTNASVASINVTLDDPNSAAPANATAFNPDVVVAVGAGVTKYIKITDFDRFKDKTTGRVLATCSATTSVTVEAFTI